jgi:hypothetical protein
MRPRHRSHPRPRIVEKRVPGSGVRIVNPARPSSCVSTKPHSHSKSDPAQSGSMTKLPVTP